MNNTWGLLNIFTGRQVHDYLSSDKIDSLQNLIRLEENYHDFFGSWFYVPLIYGNSSTALLSANRPIFLEFPGQEGIYVVHIHRKPRGYRARETVNLKSISPLIHPDPSPFLHKVHASLSQLLRVSGTAAGKVINKILCEWGRPEGDGGGGRRDGPGRRLMEAGGGARSQARG